MLLCNEPQIQCLILAHDNNGSVHLRKCRQEPNKAESQPNNISLTLNFISSFFRILTNKKEPITREDTSKGKKSKQNETKERIALDIFPYRGIIFN